MAIKSFENEEKSLALLEKANDNIKAAFEVFDYRTALYHIEQALKIAAASRILKLSRAECLAFLGRYAEAQNVANDLLRLDSTNVEAIYVRGLCLYYEDNVDKALTHFQQVLRLAPDHAKAKEAFKVSILFAISFIVSFFKMITSGKTTVKIVAMVRMFHLAMSPPPTIW